MDADRSVQGADTAAHIEVQGTGVASVDPDRAVISAGVRVVGARLEPTRTAANEKIQRAMRVLDEAGVERRQVQTDRFNVHYDAHAQRHHVSTMLSITVTDLDSVEALIDDLFAAIGDGLEVHGVSFGAADASDAARRARALAFADAEAKAAQLAELAGRVLGPVLAVTEHDGPGRPIARRSAKVMMAAERSDAMPIESGELDHSVSLSVIWSLAD